MHSGDEMDQPAASKLTYDDFLCFPDDGRRHELIDGEHFVTPSPSLRHQRVSRDLLWALHEYCRVTGVAETFIAPLDVVLSNHDVVEPDLFVVLKAQRQILTARNVQGPPAIVIEILSPGTKQRDETLKRRLYGRAGVREYWLADVDRDAVRICVAGPDGEMATAADLEAAAGHVLTSALLPGFSLALAGLFAQPEA